MMGPDGDPHDGKLPGDDGPTLFNALVSSIEETPADELAELIEPVIDTLEGLARTWRPTNPAETARRNQVALALSYLREITEPGSDDPRQNGWVDDRGRP